MKTLHPHRSRALTALVTLSLLFTSACYDASLSEDVCRTNVEGCEPSHFSCDTSPTCYALMEGCLESGECDAETSSGSGETRVRGEIAFWTQFEQCGSIPHDFCVFISGERSCTSPQNTAPACESSGAASISLPAGIYTYSASVLSGALDESWSGTVEVIANQCQLIQLYCQ